MKLILEPSQGRIVVYLGKTQSEDGRDLPRQKTQANVCHNVHRLREKMLSSLAKMRAFMALRR